MTFLVCNPYTNDLIEFENEIEANAKAKEIQDDLLFREEYRFTVAKEIVNGSDTTWMNADLNNDPEEGAYFVFNTFVGQHEKTNSLSAAKARREELRKQFIDSMKIVSVKETSSLVQPISVGAQTL